MAPLILSLLAAAFAISPEQLQSQLQAGEPITVVDIRDLGFYQRGHIPGAIRLDPDHLTERKLPELGRVVVMGDGLDKGVVDAAVAALDAKPGIDAEALDGGWGAWESHTTWSTAASGLSTAPTMRELTWTQLRALSLSDGADIVLVDLRTTQERTSFAVAGLGGLHVVRASGADPDRVLRQVLSRRSELEGRPVVLVDDGDGVARRLAGKLRAAGLARVGILVGGEHALQARDAVQQRVLRSSGVAGEAAGPAGD